MIEALEQNINRRTREVISKQSKKMMKMKSDESTPNRERSVILTRRKEACKRLEGVRRRREEKA
jgi:hypothetical protein